MPVNIAAPLSCCPSPVPSEKLESSQVDLSGDPFPAESGTKNSVLSTRRRSHATPPTLSIERSLCLAGPPTIIIVRTLTIGTIRTQRRPNSVTARR